LVRKSIKLSSKAALKNYSLILILAFVSMVSFRQSAVRAEEKPPCLYSVDAGKIILYTGDTARSVSIGGNIAGHCRRDDGIYYITIKPEGNSGCAYIGFVFFQSGEIRFEKKLPLNSEELTVKKFMVAEGVAYILIEPRLSNGNGRILKRVNLNSMEIDQLADVLDYQVQGRELVLLSKRGSGIAVVCNETPVTITLPGEGLLKISVVMDGRMVFVTNSIETEIVDIRSGKNLYRYANDKEFQMPDEYNLIIQAEDSQVSEQDDRDMVFYKVFIDGIESGRTDSGPARLTREFRIKVDMNKYHLVKLERWALNAARGRYDRENNIRQPKIENLFIPMNRIVKMVIKYNNKNYNYEIAPVYK
jgi:hypothetical protein